MAVLSSNIDAPIPTNTVFAGEVGLSGEIRAVSRIEQRVLEAEKLGFQQIFVPAGNKKALTKVPAHIKVRFVSRVVSYSAKSFIHIAFFFELTIL